MVSRAQGAGTALVCPGLLRSHSDPFAPPKTNIKQGEVAEWTGQSRCMWTLYASCLPCCAVTHLRGIVRERQNISGDCFGDCMLACYCFPCATTQLYSECAASKVEERKKQKRMEDMLEQGRLGSPMPGGTTVVYAPSPPPHPMYSPQQVYPAQPHPVPMVAAAPYPPPPSPGKNGAYPAGHAAY